jgi:hypothetical protein
MTVYPDDKIVFRSSLLIAGRAPDKLAINLLLVVTSGRGLKMREAEYGLVYTRKAASCT